MEADESIDIEKIKNLFFDPSNGYGSTLAKEVVNEVLKAHRKVTDYLSRYLDPNERKDLQQDTVYGDHEAQLRHTLNLVFDVSFDHGANNPYARFWKAVQTLGLNDGQDDDVNPEVSAEHYFSKYRDALITHLIHQAEMKRIMKSPR